MWRSKYGEHYTKFILWRILQLDQTSLNKAVWILQKNDSKLYGTLNWVRLDTIMLRTENRFIQIHGTLHWGKYMKSLLFLERVESITLRSSDGTPSTKYWTEQHWGEQMVHNTEYWTELHWRYHVNYTKGNIWGYYRTLFWVPISENIELRTDCEKHNADNRRNGWPAC